jgi:hypothetical protein
MLLRTRTASAVITGALLAAALAACDPIAISALALEPSPQFEADSFHRLAFQIVDEVAAEYAVEQFIPLENEVGWRSCYMRAGFTICAKTLDREVHLKTDRLASNETEPSR